MGHVIQPYGVIISLAIGNINDCNIVSNGKSRKVRFRSSDYDSRGNLSVSRSIVDCVSIGCKCILFMILVVSALNYILLNKPFCTRQRHHIAVLNYASHSLETHL